MGARPGTMRARVSLARSLVPITKPVSRLSESAALAASARMLKMAAGVSIMAHSRTRRSVWVSNSRCAIISICSGVDIVAKPRRVERVEPNDHLAMPESPGAHGLCHLDARIRLGVGRDRVLEI